MHKNNFKFLLVSTFFLLLCSLAEAKSERLLPSIDVLGQDITDTIPVINQAEDAYQKIPDVAQYKGADWSKVIGIAKGISLAEAKQIADLDPNITFFFYTKGYQMILEKEDGTYRRFNKGDSVFFGGDPWWGSAPGLADGYVKKAIIP